MTSPNQPDGRTTPRVNAALEVNVEVAGETKRVFLVTKDIGAGGMYMRTPDPAPLFKRVILRINLPNASQLEVSGEVVRRVTRAQAKEKNQPSGMAVAFDEISRKRRKELIAAVLDLFSRKPNEKTETPVTSAAKRQVPSAAGPARKTPLKPTPAEQPARPEEDPADEFDSKTDSLLLQLDELLDAVEDENGEKSAQPKEPGDKLAAKDLPQEPQVDSPATKTGAAEAQVHTKSPAAKKPTPATKAQIAQLNRLRSFLASYQRSLGGDTHYDILGVEQSADKELIKGAYRRLLRVLTPPLPQEEMPEDLLNELSVVLEKIRKAFAILTKPDRRQAYDYLLSNNR